MRQFDRPYLLLTLASLFWAGNTIVGRASVDLVAPATLTLVRWALACAVVLPIALPHVQRDWAAIRQNLAAIVLLALIGSAGYNVIAYLALHYTQAINSLLLQSVAPLFVAVWSFVLFRDRLTLVQAAGITISMTGALVIVGRGDLGVLARLEFNVGDLMILGALVFYALYTALLRVRPAMHPLAFLASIIAAKRRPDGAAGRPRGRDRTRTGAHARHLRGVRLSRDLSFSARLFLPQPRHRADRRQPRGAVHPSDAGVRLAP